MDIILTANLRQTSAVLLFLNWHVHFEPFIIKSSSLTQTTPTLLRLFKFTGSAGFTATWLHFLSALYHQIEIELTQQVGPFIHIPYKPRACRRQLFKQRFCVAVKRQVLDAFGGGTTVMTRTGGDFCNLVKLSIKLPEHNVLSTTCWPCIHSDPCPAQGWTQWCPVRLSCRHCQANLHKRTLTKCLNECPKQFHEHTSASLLTMMV